MDRSNVRRVTFPRISRQTAQSLNAVVGSLEHIKESLLPALANALGVKVDVLGLPKASSGTANALCVRLAQENAYCTVGVESQLTDFVGKALLKQSGRFDSACIGYLTLVGLRALNSSWRLQDVTWDTTPEGLAEIEMGLLGHTGRLWVDAQNVAAKGLPVRESLLADTSFAVAVVIGSGRIAQTETAQLEPGDVVILDLLSDIRCGGEATLLVGQFRADARINDDRVIVKCIWKGEPVMSDISVAEAISVELIAEAGRLQMTGRELMSLQPGMVLDLGRAVNDGVDLVLQGRAIARAEIVDIEGTLGLRVLEIFPR